MLLSLQCNLPRSRLKSNKWSLLNKLLKALRRSSRSSNSREAGLMNGNNSLLQDSQIRTMAVMVDKIKTQTTIKDKDRTIPETTTTTLVQDLSTTEEVKDNSEAMVSIETRITAKEEATTMPTMSQISIIWKFIVIVFKYLIYLFVYQLFIVNIPLLVLHYKLLLFWTRTAPTSFVFDLWSLAFLSCSASFAFCWSSVAVVLVRPPSDFKPDLGWVVSDLAAARWRLRQPTPASYFEFRSSSLVARSDSQLLVARPRLHCFQLRCFSKLKLEPVSTAFL